MNEVQEIISNIYSAISMLAVNNDMLLLVVFAVALIGFRLGRLWGMLKNFIALAIVVLGLYAMPINNQLNTDLLNLSASLEENGINNSQFDKILNSVCNSSSPINIWEYKKLLDAFMSDQKDFFKEHAVFNIANIENQNKLGICQNTNSMRQKSIN
ncbi:hypothetical protein R4575_18000 [Acinetobacter baumannii]|nr:hypothetical protein [Acinetobacter baumannii]